MTALNDPPRRLGVSTLLAALALSGCATGPAAPHEAPTVATSTTPAPAPAPAPASVSAAAPVPAPAAMPAPAPAAISAPLQVPPDRATAAAPQGFAQWVAAFRAEARAAGIDAATLATAFDGVQELVQVVRLDRAQPEFTRAIWDYLDTAVSPLRVTRGQDKLREVRTETEAAAARYGVPPEIVVAIWGMESNYGSYTGNTPTIDALATLAFEGRRAAWARGQLMAALRILQSGDIARERMLGSWAGAMGQTQFLPSNYLAYAVDADGDGRRDIWGSMADVTASTAHFLQREGWQRGQPWGVEVLLPPGFDLGRADERQRQPSALWAAEGLRSADGSPLPELPDAALLLPAGARGPAFLVGPNFRTILRYNNATSYALGVALLAQRIAGGTGVQAAWPRDLAPLSRAELQALQQALNTRGFDSGAPDGVLGPATRGALRRYQQSQGLAADGYPTAELLRQLLAR